MKAAQNQLRSSLLVSSQGKVKNSNSQQKPLFSFSGCEAKADMNEGNQIQHNLTLVLGADPAACHNVASMQPLHLDFAINGVNDMVVT